MVLACMTCMATSGSGAGTGTLPIIYKESPGGRPAWSLAGHVPGDPRRELVLPAPAASGRRTATGAAGPPGPSTWASAWPGSSPEAELK